MIIVRSYAKLRALKSIIWILASLLIHVALGFALWFSPPEGAAVLSEEIIDLTLSNPTNGRASAPPAAALPAKLPSKVPLKQASVSSSQDGTSEKKSETSATNTNSSDAAAGATESSGETGAVNWGEVTRFPKVAKEVKATYPEEAKKAGVDGPVVLDILIDRTGKVRDVKVVSGPGYGLNESALDAIQKFEFQPALKGSESVAVKIRYTYRFKLGVN